MTMLISMKPLPYGPGNSSELTDEELQQEADNRIFQLTLDAATLSMLLHDTKTYGRRHTSTVQIEQRVNALWRGVYGCPIVS